MSTTITAYSEFAEVQKGVGYGQYLIVDAAASVGKKYPHVIASATILHGFIYIVGSSRTALEGITAVIDSTYPLENGDNMYGDYVGAIEYVFKNGLKHGRDDRR